MTSLFSGDALFGFLDPSMLALKVLAVVGGFTVGAVGTGWLAKGLAKMMAFQRVSPFLLRGSRLLGGLALGFVVWSGLGGSGTGWWPFGQGGGSGSSANGQKPNTNHQEVEGRSLAPEETLRIYMQGGKETEQDQRFYKVEKEEPRTWEDLEPILADRNQNSKLKVIEIVIGNGSVDEQSEAVHELEAWASRNGVAVKKTASR